MPGRDLAEEQRDIDHAYRCLERMRARSEDLLASMKGADLDEVIRAPAGGILAVQGGPGSGKTAVGLHRAAFLLYGDDAMARASVLVVGPNRTFLRYIAQVLPSLGEHAVVQTTLADLVPEVRVVAGSSDSPETERLKGDPRMADVLRRSVEQRRRRELRRQPGLKDALDRRWPSVPAAALVAELFSQPARLAAAASGILTVTSNGCCSLAGAGPGPLLMPRSWTRPRT